MSQYPYIFTSNSLTVILRGQPYTIDRSNQNYDALIDGIRTGEKEDALINLINKAKAIEVWGKGTVQVKGGHVYHNGRVVHGVIVDKIFEFIKDGLSPEPLIKFLENLLLNPSHRSVAELYSFLEHGSMPITPDGYFLGYKSLREDYTDHHTGKINNKPGAVIPRMERNQVDDDANRGCSYGYHVGSLAYAQSFGGSNSRIVIAKVNPADVVSVPHECDHQKLRTCDYSVVGEFTSPLPNGYCAKYEKPLRDSKGRFVARKK